MDQDLAKLRNNPHLDKSTTPRNGILTTSNTQHLILRIFHHKSTKLVKHHLQHTINLTITPQPTIHNICQLHRSHTLRQLHRLHIPQQFRKLSTQCKTITLKSKMKPIHQNHLRHKPKNPNNKMKSSQLMAQSSQLSEVLIPIFTPSGSAKIITEK
jgi:hypothetical protein